MWLFRSIASRTNEFKEYVVSQITKCLIVISLIEHRYIYESALISDRPAFLSYFRCILARGGALRSEISDILSALICSRNHHYFQFPRQNLFPLLRPSTSPIFANRAR